MPEVWVGMMQGSQQSQAYRPDLQLRVVGFGGEPGTEQRHGMRVEPGEHAVEFLVGHHKCTSASLGTLVAQRTELPREPRTHRFIADIAFSAIVAPAPILCVW